MTDSIENDPDNVSLLCKSQTLLAPSAPLKLFLQATETDAFLVLLDGQIAFEYYASGNDAQTPHVLMSASKSVVGLIVSMLENIGEISTAACASDYLPEIRDTPYDGVTIRQLLDMRSGVKFTPLQHSKYMVATGWDPQPNDDSVTGTRSFFASLVGTNARNNGPFDYVTANTDLLGLAVERATGRSFAALVSELLWKPMGAEHAAYITVDCDGTPRCAGGLCVSIRDFARVGQLLIDGGKRRAAQIIPQSVVEDVLHNGDRRAWRDGQWANTFAFISRNMSYRNGWYVVHDQPNLAFAMGVHDKTCL